MWPARTCVQRAATVCIQRKTTSLSSSCWLNLATRVNPHKRLANGVGGWIEEGVVAIVCLLRGTSVMT
jgi:hypothetical protein